MTDEPGSVDDYLTRLADGREVSTDELAPVVYDDLRRLADAFFLREKPGITLQPTALVHEAYMALADQDRQSWQGRRQFLTVAARAMRRVLIDAARARSTQKRGGRMERVTLSDQESTDALEVDLLDLEEALERLAQTKQRYADIVELRFFAGMSIEEVAEVLGVSHTIVVREWIKAKAWLAVELEDLERGPR